VIEIDIVTPSRKLVEGIKVPDVRIPSASGELQILPGHTELLTLLGTGVLSFSNEGRTRRYAISGGFAEVRNNKVTVMAESCEESKDIDKAKARAEQLAAEEALSAVLSEDEFKEQQVVLERAIVRQKVADH
jgi:F-type H+-transporting ATPase subunit epsilon